MTNQQLSFLKDYNNTVYMGKPCYYREFTRLASAHNAADSARSLGFRAVAEFALRSDLVIRYVVYIPQQQ